MNAGCASKATDRRAWGSTFSSNRLFRDSPPSSATHAARCSPRRGACKTPCEKSANAESCTPQFGSAKISAAAASMIIQHRKLAVCACTARSKNAAFCLEWSSLTSAPSSVTSAPSSVPSCGLTRGPRPKRCRSVRGAETRPSSTSSVVVVRVGWRRPRGDSFTPPPRNGASPSAWLCTSSPWSAAPFSPWSDAPRCSPPWTDESRCNFLSVALCASAILKENDRSEPCRA
mmetsp:Transcript_32544/g.114494  ORF Transcript_32544/g.114494 Transcript_32544/m.114494 type:complete len:231 (-) Transcript_32544:2441-3133(-)